MTIICSLDSAQWVVKFDYFQAEIFSGKLVRKSPHPLMQQCCVSQVDMREWDKHSVLLMNLLHGSVKGSGKC